MEMDEDQLTELLNILACALTPGRRKDRAIELVEHLTQKSAQAKAQHLLRKLRSRASVDTVKMLRYTRQCFECSAQVHTPQASGPVLCWNCTRGRRDNGR